MSKSKLDNVIKKNASICFNYVTLGILSVSEESRSILLEYEKIIRQCLRMRIYGNLDDCTVEIVIGEDEIGTETTDKEIFYLIFLDESKCLNNIITAFTDEKIFCFTANPIPKEL